MSLKDSWLAGRLHRQHELAQRQQDVQQTLVDFGQARQQMAAQLHSNLAIFRDALSQQESERRLDMQMFQAELQAFHAELQANVRSLRLDMNTDLAMLQAETQTFLINCQHQRMHVNLETRQSLADFMENLRMDVQSYLAELELTRQHRAEQVQQDLQASRASREADVEALFANLATFRAELQQFRQTLREDVWGQSVPNEPVVTQSALTKVTAIPAAKPSVPKPASTRPIAGKSTPARSVSPGKTTPTKSSAKTAAKPTPAAKTVTAAKVSVPQTATPPMIAPEVPFEKEVYTFLYENQGARLTQIETSLNLNRFQAVDALRSLIKKGLITQRDRVYLTQAQD
ncbi:MAG: hypothetical protein NW224_27935 [Leptolyngbyaceae cyanobacterium bins.302]|nr:hypothetical protein [Leptolyngbyaceae cyanobacterium bins.302]